MTKGEFRFEDPNRTRYLYVPTGMMLKAGDGGFPIPWVDFTYNWG